MGAGFSYLYHRIFGGGEYKVVMVGLDNAGKSTILYRLCGTASPAHAAAPSLHSCTPARVCRHLGDVIQTNPTVGSNVEEVMHRNVRFQVWDLGGQDKLRKVWSTYYVGAHAVVLVVDSMDRERLDIVREELSAIVTHEVQPPPRRPRAAQRHSAVATEGRRPSAVQDLSGSALLVLANKQDVEGAMTAMEISQSLKLHSLKQQSWQIQACSAVTGAAPA